jgi:hypothetical protein
MALLQSELKEVLTYCPDSGVFVWNCSRNGFVRAGQVAGSMSSKGYVYISIGYKKYQAHRLAWLWMRGNFPAKEIDHINGNPSDNRWCNLRYATRAQNQQNRKRAVVNTSGLKGVSFHKQSGLWRARITAQGKRVHLGGFNCPTAAHIAYCKAAKAYFGEFARPE